MKTDSIYSEVGQAFSNINFSRLYGKSILVTGATGLVGTYLVETVLWLNDYNHAKIKLFIINHNGLPQHLNFISSRSDVTILIGDLADDIWRKTIPESDFIIHAAGYGQPGKFVQDQVKTIKINTSASFDLLEKTKKGGSFLFLSTSEVYNGIDNKSCSEEDIGNTTPLHPRACYIEGKRCGEAICNAYRAKGIDAKSVRLALAYGPGTRETDRRVLNEFIKRALIQRELSMLDSGSAIRTYCYVTDAVEFMWNILLNGQEALYNVGGRSSTSIHDLAAQIASIVGVPFIVPENEESGMIGAPSNVSMSIEKAENEFNKHNYVPLEEGLRRTINWQRCNLYC